MDVVFYIPGVILLVTAVLNLPAMRGAWRDPLMAASISVLLIGALVCMLSAPPTIGVVNDLTGIANFSAPLVYSGMSALSACYLVLMIAWRGGEPGRVARATRLVVCVYGLVIIGIVTLFALADVPVERTRDLDTYYARTPYMREMILLYLVAHTAATAALAGMCLAWLRKVRDLTRTGLTLIVVGVLFDLSYQIAKYLAIGARWGGLDWDFLSTSLSPPLVAVAGVAVAAGFALPRVGPSTADNFRAWRRYRLLRPLWLELRDLRTPVADTHWWDLPVVRLVQQEITILDGVLVCSPYLDNEVRRAVALDHAEIVAEAAMLAAARVHVSVGPDAELPSEVGRLLSVAQPDLMVQLARALSSSPVVAEVRQRAARQRTARQKARHAHDDRDHDRDQERHRDRDRDQERNRDLDHERNRDHDRDRDRT
ncbi:MAB_1171c family putative transporter [Streptomyces tauricus]|uniref:MAB_1171c family putative transporter n=1 Tax=Streptomyces tauricus TaxID=68274 RepID=UPI00382485AF